MLLQTHLPKKKTNLFSIDSKVLLISGVIPKNKVRD